MVLYEDDPEDRTQEDDPTYECESDTDNEVLEYQSDYSDVEVEASPALPGQIEEGETGEVEEDGADDDPSGVPEWTFRIIGPEASVLEELYPLSAIMVVGKEMPDEKDVFQA